MMVVVACVNDYYYWAEKMTILSIGGRRRFIVFVPTGNGSQFTGAERCAFWFGLNATTQLTVFGRTTIYSPYYPVNRHYCSQHGQTIDSITPFACCYLNGLP